MYPEGGSGVTDGFFRLFARMLRSSLCLPFLLLGLTVEVAMAELVLSQGASVVSLASRSQRPILSIGQKSPVVPIIPVVSVSSTSTYSNGSLDVIALSDFKLFTLLIKLSTVL